MTNLAISAISVEQVNDDADVLLGEDIEHLWTVCQETLDHRQHLVSERRQRQLLHEHSQPPLRGKLAAVVMVTSDHGSWGRGSIIIVIACNGVNSLWSGPLNELDP